MYRLVKISPLFFSLVRAAMGKALLEAILQRSRCAIAQGAVAKPIASLASFLTYSKILLSLIMPKYVI